MAGEFFVWPLTRRMVRLFEDTGVRVCRECGRVCADSRGMGAHMHYKHGVLGASATAVAYRAKSTQQGTSAGA